MRRAMVYLREAENLIDKTCLLELAKSDGWKGFRAGGEWMRAALGVLRDNRVPRGVARFHWLGIGKYFCAGLVALIPVGAAAFFGSIALGIVSIPAAILCFYIVEVQGLFLFPAALDEANTPWRRSRKLLLRCGGTIPGVAGVLPIAWYMLTGNFRSIDPLKNWAVGCLAVLLWYEDVRADDTVPSYLVKENEVARLQAWNRGALLLRREIVTAKIGMRCRVLWLSDLHLRSGKVSALNLARLLKIIRSENPDAVILGGDLCDSKSGFEALFGFVRTAVKQVPILAIPGNHDEWLGMELIAEGIRCAGGHWLPDGSVVLSGGIRAASVEGATKHDDNLVLWCLHDPKQVNRLPPGRAIALAGHLHGCQFVSRTGIDGWYPGRWFYRWNGARFEWEEKTLIVSRGVSDTIPFRWQCPREVILLEIS